MKVRVKKSVQINSPFLENALTLSLYNLELGNFLPNYYVHMIIHKAQKNILSPNKSEKLECSLTLC